MSADARLLVLLDTALALDPAEREAWLDGACAGDASLRADVARLLALDATSPDFLQPWPQPRPRHGERVDAYRLLEEIGSGGMGTVYLAERADALYDKRVAIKFLRFDAGPMRERFASERRILAGLDHPDIARLLDAGQDARGVPYVVMEHVEGEPIDRYCETRRLDVRARVALFAKVLGAVQHAHGRLVVHRDLKPANILVTPAGEPRLLDFGIAKLVGDADGVTRTGVAPMTPDYASPEQVRGEEIGTASDIYSLGVLLYELLAGARPYRTESAAPSDIERMVARTQPALPSATAQVHGRARIDRDLDHVALKALAKSPVDRYASCSAFADDLRRYLDGDAVLAVHAGRAYRARKFVLRHRVGVAVALAVAVALVGFALVALQQAGAAREQARVASLERDRAARIAAFLQEMLAAPDPGALGRNVTVASVLDQAADSVDTQLGAEPGVAATLHLTLSRTYRGLGLLDSALEQSRLATARLDALDADAPERARIEVEHGLVLLARGALDEAGASFERAQAQAARLGDAITAAESDDSLGVVHRARGDDAKAEQHYLRALATYRAMQPPDAGRIATVLNNLAVVRGNRGDVAASIALHEEAVGLMRGTHAGAHPELARTLFNLANARELGDDFEGAARSYEEALAMQTTLLGDGHADTVQTLASFAWLRLRQGDPTAARDLARRAYDAARAHLPDPHPMTAYAASMLGEALLAGDQASEAEPVLRAALQARRSLLPDGHPLIANSESLLGAALLKAGDRAQGEPLMQHAVATLRASLGEEHELTRRCVARLAQFAAR
jgi:serine/threonine-protein kinase